MESNTAAIIRLAWSRRLGLADDALEAPEELIKVERDDRLSYLRLFRAAVLTGPANALDAAPDDDRERLADGRALLTLLSAEQTRTARLAGAAGLAYTDGYCRDVDTDGAVISDDRAAAAEVERTCPPDDIVEARLHEMPHQYVLYDFRESPVAVAAARDWQQVIARLSVLVGLPYRRQGHGRLVAAAAVNDLLDAGLIPEWRARLDHPASNGLAGQLGFEPVGSQTTVVFDPPAGGSGDH
jgi:hypothetical protein